MTSGGLDPVTFEVIWHKLLDITEEMGIKYMRTTASTVLAGSYDAGSGITLPDGQLVAIGPYITTQANVLPLIVRAVSERASVNPGIRQGDMFICNDPYVGATHQPDVVTVAPSFHEGELMAWVGASGHWLDVGGQEPGSFNMKARSVLEEGLRMPPTRIVEGGRLRDDIAALVMNQIREPLAELDMRGQIVANSSGLERLSDLYENYGHGTVQAVMHEAIDHVERRMRARLRELPDGVWREVQYLDHDGHEPTLHKLVCTVTKRGGTLTVDFTGSDPQANGSINCTYSGIRAATLSAMYILLAYDLPWNDGVARCLDLIAPPGLVCTAVYPAPVSSSTITSIIVGLNCVFGALSKILLTSPHLYEEAMANWCSTSLAPTIAGINEQGDMTVTGESSHFGAGTGARTYKDGVDTGGIIINTTASIPSIESIEADYPVLYLFRRQLTDSGGPGRFRGGVSGEVALVPYDAGGPLETAFSGSGAEVPNAFGLAGGLPGATVRYLRFSSTSVQAKIERGEPLPGSLEEIDGDRHVTYLKNPHSAFPSDMVEYHNWQGGGGYGDPIDREPVHVYEDVANGLVSPKVAEEVYGVITKDGTLQRDSTEERRKAMREERKQRAKPAREVVELHRGTEAPAQIGRAQARTGTLRYGDLVRMDLAADTVSCLRCKQELGVAHEDFRLGCLVEQVPTNNAGPVRGEDYDQGRVQLRLYYCPGCASQLDAEVLVEGAPAPSFVLL